MKVLIVLATCIAAALSKDCTRSGCPSGQCCISDGVSSTADERYMCGPLGKEGDGCFPSDTYESYMKKPSSEYLFFCPCGKGLKCDKRPSGKESYFSCQE